jgi:serine/threonine-protein kinase HipA
MTDAAIRVWVDRASVGMLERQHSAMRGSAFTYLPNARNVDAVSLTMPVRSESWTFSSGLAPIFDMNLPEGALREKLRQRFAKAAGGTFDSFDILNVVGRSQIGRLRFTEVDEDVHEDVPFQSVEEILEVRRSGNVLAELIDRFARYSGVSGVQPKVMVRDESAVYVFQESPAYAFQDPQAKDMRQSQNIRGATHIVKLWEQNEFPELAANEFFCLKVAQACGFDVPRFQLAEDGKALVIDRFDLKTDGTYKGVEDFCVLNAYTSDQKYFGSYESQVFKCFKQYMDPQNYVAQREKIFMLIALNCALQNGDAHLKNFAITYDNAASAPHLAPVYDLVTTTAYIPGDQMALTLNGTKHWPAAKTLSKFAEPRLQLPPRKIADIFMRLADAIADTRPQLRAYMKARPAFAPIGERMLAAWETGVAHSLRL